MTIYSEVLAANRCLPAQLSTISEVLNVLRVTTTMAPLVFKGDPVKTRGFLIKLMAVAMQGVEITDHRTHLRLWREPELEDAADAADFEDGK